TTLARCGSGLPRTFLYLHPCPCEDDLTVLKDSPEPPMFRNLLVIWSEIHPHYQSAIVQMRSCPNPSGLRKVRAAGPKTRGAICDPLPRSGVLVREAASDA